MKLLKLMASFIGAIALIAGVSSCKDEETIECCTSTETYTYDGVTETYTINACANGTYSYVETDGTTGSGNWNDDGDYSWDEIKSYILDNGGSCS